MVNPYQSYLTKLLSEHNHFHKPSSAEVGSAQAGALGVFSVVPVIVRFAVLRPFVSDFKNSRVYLPAATEQ
jgi:hypothetical protein